MIGKLVRFLIRLYWKLIGKNGMKIAIAAHDIKAGQVVYFVDSDHVRAADASKAEPIMGIAIANKEAGENLTVIVKGRI